MWKCGEKQMSVTEIISNIFSMLLVGFSSTIISKYYFSKIKKIESNYEELAKINKTVKIDKIFLRVFVVMAIFANIIGIIIFALPNFVANVLGFNYLVTIIIWWLPLMFNNIILIFMFTEASYNNEQIIVKTVFKTKIYKLDEIIYFSKSGNLKVKTTRGNFLLFNAMYGTLHLREFLLSKNIGDNKNN